MEFNIVIEKDNPLFKRKEIEGTIKAEVCPSKQEVAKALSKKYSVAEENIIIETIEGRFGAREFLLVAQLYESKEAKDFAEVKTKKQREAEAKAAEDAAKATEGVESSAPAQPQQEPPGGTSNEDSKESVESKSEAPKQEEIKEESKEEKKE